MTGRGPNILFLLIDCLRADMCWGETRQVVTPTIDRLAKRGTVFLQAVAASNGTPPCVATILTGLYPFRHRTRAMRGPRPSKECMTLPEILKANGYRTIAMVTGPLLPSLGLNRGFDEYAHRGYRETLLSSFFDQARASLDRQSAEPWFLFLHLWELHRPRQIASGFDHARYGSKPYLRALSSLDSYLGRLLANLDFDTTMVVLSADHGEGFANRLWDGVALFEAKRRLVKRLARFIPNPSRFIRRWWIGHGAFLYDFLLRVPLFIVGGGVPSGRIVRDQVRQVDIFPTLLECAGISLPLGIALDGRSLNPLMQGEALPELPAYAETVGRGARKPVAVRTSRWKQICDRRSGCVRDELYDLESDPEERTNLARHRQDVARQMHQILEAIRDHGAGLSGLGEETLSPEEKTELEAHLRDLGYL